MRLGAVEEDGRFQGELHYSEKVAVDPETFYVASLWAKGTGPSRIQIQKYSDGKWLGGRSSIHTDLTEEWTEYRFYFGAVEEGLTNVRFSVYVEGKDSYALIDDASFSRIGPTQPHGENLMTNGDMEADADDDAMPDEWHLGRPLEGDQRDLAIGADGGRALYCQCSPRATTVDERMDLSNWWDWASNPPSSAGWVAAASSKDFAVDPGRTYEIKFQLRGRGVRAYHTKMWWLDEDGKPIEWFTIGPRHDGDWDWEDVTLGLTVPSAHVHGARLEFWALAAGGGLWIDNVSVRPSRSYSLGWVAAEYDVDPVETTTAPPTLASPASPTRGTQDVSLKPRPKSRLVETEDGLDILLKSGVDLRIPLDDGNIMGVSDVTLGGLPLRNAEAPPIAPLVETESGGHYASCRYVNHDVGRDGSVVIHSELVTTNGRADRLDWTFEPRREEIEGRKHVGFAYQYRLETDGDGITRIDDRTTWELGGDPIGATVITQNSYNVQNVFTVTPESTYCGTGGPRFAGGDGLDYQHSGSGALAVLYEGRVPHVNSTRLGTERWIEYRDSMPLAGVTEAETPRKLVLFAERGGHDEWTRLRDYANNAQATEWGIRQPTPLPVANCWMHWKELAEHGDRILYDIADEAAPKLGEMGFKVLAIHSVWGRGGCSLDAIEVGEKFGGTEALKYLCDKAAEHGMIVQAWAPTAHLWQYSPLVETPGWLIEGPNGGPPSNYCYPEIRGLRFTAGWADYAVEQWRKVREETGLGSLWMDSYNNFSHHINAADRKVYVEQAEELFRFHARMADLGYVLYIESTGTLGIPAPSFPIANIDSPNPGGPDPMTRHGVSGYMSHTGNEAQDRAANEVVTRGDYYYRSLACKSPCWVSWPTFGDTPEVHEKIGQANRDYCAVVEQMQYRRTLPDDAGVEWTNANDRSRVLFSFADARYECDGLRSAWDVTADEAMEIVGGGFVPQPTHTYKIEAGK